jgi:hypothetical protein
MRFTRQPEQQQQRALSAPPPCPGCTRTMRLVGRETNRDAPSTEVLTFNCDCGHITTTVTGQ